MTNTKKRGFAAMDKELQRKIASKGGKASHEMGVAHEWTVDTATAASQKAKISQRANADRRKGVLPSDTKSE